MDEKQKRILILQQEIINLKSELSGENSDIGDYKMVKTYEALLKGEVDNTIQTHFSQKGRQSVRDKINELQKELEEITDGAEEQS